MSDHESNHGDHKVEHHLSPSLSHNSMRTAALHDHRHQADSLPIRRGSAFNLPPAALNPNSSVPDNNSAVTDSPVIKSNSPQISVLKTPIVNEASRASSFRDGRQRSRSVGEYKMRLSRGSENLSPLMHPINKTFTRTSLRQQGDNEEHRRRMTRTSMDSDADSHASRDSQETEEDVCFPMVPEHVKINGIDFDEIEDFIQECREEGIQFKKEQGFNTGSSSDLSSAALKYTPKSELEGQGVSFGLNKVEGQDVPPDRFSFFCSESEETVHAPDIESLVKPGQSVQDLFRNGEDTWWLDCSCPTDAEMKVLTKAFGIHPLTAEDIRMQETREKVELFKSYYFVCFHTFESDHESEDFLEPINIYIVVFKHGVLTFHFNPISHAINVRRRVRQLRDYVDVSADWLCYALIDDITDSFAPIINSIEYEADVIEDQVFLTREMDVSLMLQKIGISRRKVMTLMKLLSGKADVIKMFAKRCQDEVQGAGSVAAHLAHVNLANLSADSTTHHFPASQHTVGGQQQAQPRADIALYLGDIQDHVVTMYQNLLSYEKIFSRSHSSYLAQMQVESFYSNLRVTEMLSKVTVIGTILVPMNLITGLFGMNVRVPGESVSNLGPFFGIFGLVLVLVITFSVGANWFLNRAERQAAEEGMFSGGRSVLNWVRRRNHQTGRSRETRSLLSTPASRLNRYD